ncbi:MAG: hypothetical protein GY761_14555 [Hyphomicrobiales bacterium]|nr:hypothetical protein [Hyphomicrobiales bacterium]
MRIEFFQSKYRLLMKSGGLLFCFFLASCVSSAVKPTVPEPVSPSLQFSLSEDEQRSKKLREAAIAEIHAKAEAAPHNEQAPDNGYHRAGETSPLTPQEIAEKTSKIKASSGGVPPAETEQEIAARQRKMNALRRKGRNHYNTALRNIETE